MDIEKRIEELEKTLMRLESRYSQSNPVDVLAMRALKREISRLNTELATGKTPSLGVGEASS
jgi:ribosomal protein L29